VHSESTTAAAGEPHFAEVAMIDDTLPGRSDAVAAVVVDLARGKRVGVRTLATRTTSASIGGTSWLRRHGLTSAYRSQEAEEKLATCGLKSRIHRRGIPEQAAHRAAGSYNQDPLIGAGARRA
jgi:hypothetical protein